MAVVLLHSRGRTHRMRFLTDYDNDGNVDGARGDSSSGSGDGGGVLCCGAAFVGLVLSVV